VLTGAHNRRRRVTICLAAIAGLLSAACAKPAPAIAPAAGDLDLKGAVQQIAGDLAKQMGPATDARTMVIDPILDRATGQQTGTTVRLEREIGPALTTSIKGLSLLEFNSDGAAKSRFLLTGTIAAGGEPTQYVASIALTDRQSGLVVAQSAARFREAGLDGAPTALYRDSPSLVHDRFSDGYVRTAETAAGKPADALYVEQVPTAALLAEALTAYNAGRFDQALTNYTTAASRQDGQQLRTFNGIYLSNLRLGRTAAAEDAFGKIAALGLATNNLAVKLLFRPGSATDFFPGPEFSGAYPMWLRQIARTVQASRSCLNIVGHTSRSGSEAVNDRLSVSRAETVKRMLEAEVRGLTTQLRASGVGYRENIIGTGADDASDAVDRRVEFKVVACGT
jgi:outer membrane protein OmpA-like peptidoglycan-associated protein